MPSEILIGSLVKILGFYPEVCCEFCGEVIHNHFTCPSCKKDYAGTNIYCAIYEEEWIADDPQLLCCEECGITLKWKQKNEEETYPDIDTESEWIVVQLPYKLEAENAS